MHHRHKGDTAIKTIHSVGIIGAGALGVMYAQQLTKTLGKDRVFFIADSARVARYEQTPFTLNGEACDFRFISPEDAETKADLLLFAVKYTSIYDAIKSAKPFAHGQTILLSVLNGIASEERLAEAFGEENLLYCVAQGMDALKEDNHFRYTQMGELLIGEARNRPCDKLRLACTLLDEAQIPYRVPEDIRLALWSKLMLNTGVNQTCACYETNFGGIQRPGEAQDTMLAAMEEVRVIANEQGINLTKDTVRQWICVLNTLAPENMPSMRQDTKAGRKTEVELFSGTICKLGRELGVPTPVNDRLYTKIKEIESKMK